MEIRFGQPYDPRFSALHSWLVFQVLVHSSSNFWHLGEAHIRSLSSMARTSPSWSLQRPAKTCRTCETCFRLARPLCPTPGTALAHSRTSRRTTIRSLNSWLSAIRIVGEIAEHHVLTYALEFLAYLNVTTQRIHQAAVAVLYRSLILVRKDEDIVRETGCTAAGGYS